MEKSNVIQFRKIPEAYPAVSSIRQTADVIHLPIKNPDPELEFREALDDEAASRAFYSEIEPRIEHLNLDLSEKVTQFQIDLAYEFQECAEDLGIPEALKYINSKLDSMSRHPATRHLVKSVDNPLHLL